MKLRVWWNRLSRAYQNALVLLAFDLLLFLGLILNIRPLKLAWEAITDFLPNIYDGIALKTLSLLRSISPGTEFISASALDAVTMLFSLLSMHLVVGFGLGFLFDHMKRSKAWDFVSFLVLIVVLFTVHFFLIVAAYL